jgi:hypothetical protein
VHASGMEVILPGGTKIRASAIRDCMEHDPGRSFGLYMDALWKPTSPAEIIGWPDFARRAAA